MMMPADFRRALRSAVDAAQASGELMRRNMHSVKKVNLATQHDIKLELDVRCQKRIERTLRQAWPAIPILGEEGITGSPETGARWVVDPIDGTVNFTYGIPHACVSIALQREIEPGTPPAAAGPTFSESGRTFESVVGVVYDPFCDELWTAVRGGPARVNGRIVHASKRTRLNQAIVSLGFAKETATLDRMLPVFNDLIHRVRKVRIMGAAALSLVYVASGRMDAYLEYGLRLWDIAAGGLIVQRAGGSFWSEPVGPDHTYQILASNRALAKPLRALAPK
jgi:myo-inositol-1(or 4)-monophosphatase